MFGEDSAGRRVSLLNDLPFIKELPHLRQQPSSSHNHLPSTSSPAVPKAHRYYSIRTSQPSRSDSSSPENLPSTPPLVRLNSISSSGTQSTPSPMTPTYPFDPLEQTKTGPPYYTNSFQPNGSGYPAPQAQDPSGPPYFHLQNPPMSPGMEEALNNLNPLQPIQTQAQFASTTDPSLTLSPAAPIVPPAVAAPPPSKPSTTTSKPTPNTSAPTPPNSKTIKKKYPCPHATRFNCHDTFTTSGHAARHGKKHTGEKNIHCPTCNKAFTRKDNMKQHERTHKSSKGGAGAAAAADLPSPTTPTTSASKPLSASSHPRKPPTSTSNSDEPGRHINDAPMEFDGDSSKLQLSNPPVLPDLMQDVRSTPNGRIPSVSGRSEVDGEGDSPGLDALAVASAIASDAR